MRLTRRVMQLLPAPMLLPLLLVLAWMIINGLATDDARRQCDRFYSLQISILL